MKIERLVLKNFSAVKNAMKANEVTIDFTSSKNNICLIIGPNGSGKTTILSMLHPFSDLGNLDVRNTNNLILDKKDGYKEIIIRKNEDLYTIKHFYTYHTSKSRNYHSVKSYISKNGEELNNNGNVSSFKEIVKDELQIEQDYLKLIRLGSNVTSLIDLSSTERKNFMSKIMDDIGVYLNYYKVINNKMKQLNDMMNHNIDKLNKLKIEDKSSYKNEIKEVKLSIKETESSYINKSNNLAIINDKYNNIDDVENIESNLKATKKKLKKMENIIDRKEEMESEDPLYYEDKIKDCNEKVIKNKALYDGNLVIIQNNLKLLDSLSSQLHTLKVQKEKEDESDKELKRMDENLTKIRKKLREYEDIIGDFKPTINKDDLENFLKFLATQEDLLYKTYDFGKPVVKKVIELMSDNKSVSKYINTHLIKIDSEKNDTDSIFLETVSKRFLNSNYDMKIKCDKECPAKTLFYQIQTLLKNNEVKEKDDNNNAVFYTNMEYAYENLTHILMQFKNYEEIIKMLPDYHKKYFITGTLYKNIKELKPIYDEEKMKDLLSLTTEYYNYEELKKEYDKEEKIKNTFSSLSSSYNIKNQIDNIEDQIDITQEDLSSLRDKNRLILEENTSLENSMVYYNDIKETLESYSSTKEKYKKYEEDSNLKYELLSNMTSIHFDMDHLDSKLKSLRKDLQEKISNLDLYNSIEKEMEHMNSVYDDLVLIKKSLSSKEGMPLKIIGRYLNNTETITNDLLNIAYDGKIFIDKFNITSNEFSIPFFNNGVRLDDVKFASQGELSFLSIALSFALSSQVLSKYNIMLLDEIDGPLDMTNREKFIKILENQIDRIHSEQNFLITHNAMFSSYPVDILDLSFKNNNSDYELANFITIERN